MENLIAEIKKKKELSGISDRFVRDVLTEYLNKNKVSDIGGKKSRKLVIKEVRAELRKHTGQFQTAKASTKRSELFKKSEFETLLRTHASTKERMSFYPAFRKEIAKLHPKSILDLGCGINPIALDLKNVKYYAADIKEDELELISRFFKLRKIRGKTFYCDLRKENRFPEADLCLILKVLDLIESKGHKLADRIVSSLRCKFLIVSFPTKKLSGKKMSHPRRFWFENLIGSKNLKFRTFESENEIFYLINFSR